MTNKYGIKAADNWNEYNSYRGMRERCYSKKHDHYKSYGGRGIKVCDRWLERGNGFAHFLIDMGKKPTKKHSIDRIDNNGNYEPSNCRWATQSEQIYNSSISKMLTIDGITDNKTGHMKRYNMNRHTITTRTNSGMSFEEALKKPLDGLSGIAQANEVRRQQALLRRNKCGWCNKICSRNANFCSRSHFMYARNSTKI